MSLIIDADENSSAYYTFDLLDETGSAVASSDLATLTLKLYDLASGDVINDRDHADILNTDGGTIDGDGHGTFTFSPDDNAIIGDGSTEIHIALFHATWAGGGLWWQRKVRVKNLDQVPAS